MSAHYKYVIVGAGTAGHFAAESIRKHDTEGSIAIIGEEPHRPYHRPPLSKGVLTGKVDPYATYLKKGNFYENNNIKVFINILVTEIDAEKKQVRMTDGQKLSYDKLLLATGGRARQLDLPGKDLDNIFTLRTLEDAQAILTAGNDARQAVIIGAGFISAEVATSLWSIGVDCTVLMRGDYLLQRVLPTEMSRQVHKEAEDFGVKILPGEQPVAFEGKTSVERIITNTGRVIECDLAVIGIGLELNTEIARDAGLEFSRDGGIYTNAFMRTSHSDIWAAGDIASYEDRSFARRLRVERTESAKGQGMIAGADMAGVEVKPYAKLPLYTFHIFDLSIKVFGCFDRSDLIRLGNLEERSAAYYSFHKNRLEGYLGFNRPYKETKMVKEQIAEKAFRVEVLESLKSLGPVEEIPDEV